MINRLISWIKNLFEKTDHVEVVFMRCPSCGSLEVGPTYVETYEGEVVVSDFVCFDCGTQEDTGMFINEHYGFLKCKVVEGYSKPEDGDTSPGSF